MRVACVQMEAYDLEDAEAGLRRALELVDEAAGDGADLVVLPECSYPAYFVRGKEEYRAASLRSWGSVTGLLGAKAREHRCHLVAGLVRPLPESDWLSNDAVIFGPTGEMIGSTAKSFLWQFDRHWFRKGCDYPVFDTPVGRIGLMICADGRMPEIARLLALRGAQVIVDSTALVTGGGDRATLTSTQIEYILPVRAIENGVWIVVANKCGLEADTILYCGRSCVIDPSGRKVVVGSSDAEEIIFSDIHLSEGPRLPVRRRPAAYRVITEPVSGQPVVPRLREAVVPEDTVTQVAVVQLEERSPSSEYLAGVERLATSLASQDAELIVLPGVVPSEIEGDPAECDRVRSHMAELSARFGVGLALTVTEYEGEKRFRTCFLWDSGELVGRYRKVHQDDGNLIAGDDLAVFDTRFGRLGIMLDDEGLLPEVPRCLMLKGADVIVWPAQSSEWPLRAVARARAEVNKVYVALATPVGGGSSIVDPGGRVAAAGLPDVAHAISAPVVWARCRYKAMAPGTDVVRDREPQTYGGLSD